HLILKIYWSCVQVSLPHFASTTTEVTAWMELFGALLTKRLPEASEGIEPLNQPTDPEERVKWPWWKVKKWTMQILTRFYMRWGNPKHVPEELAEMSKFYRSNINPTMLAGVLETLALRKNGQYCTDRVIHLCLTYMNEAVKSSIAFKQLKPHLQFLLFEVVHPTLCLTQSDLQLWKEDPHEFVRKTNDFFEDYLSPVNAARDLLNELCTLRGKDCFSNVLMFYNQILSTYLATPVEKRDVVQKDAVLHGLMSLDKLLTKSKAHKSQVEALIIAHVLPEFHNTHGFLRLRACKMFTGHFISDIKFTDATVTEIAQCMLKCMKDTELPVQIEAAKTLRYIVTYEHSEAALNVMRPLLPEIMQQYFSLMDEIGNDDVVIALEHIIDAFADEIGPYAVQLIQKLVDCFLQFSDVGEEDDEACMTAASCLDTVNTILYSIHNQPEYFPLFLEPLVPVLDRVLSNEDYLEYMESALDILISLTYHSKTIAPSVWALFPKIFTSYNGWAYDYISNFVSLIDNYVGLDVTTFLAGGVVGADGSRVSYLEMVFQMAAHVFKTSEGEEEDKSLELIAACRLLYSILHNCLRHDINVCVPMIVQITCLKLSRSLKQTVVTALFGVIASALNYNPALTLNTMESFQATEPLFRAWMTHLPNLKNYMDRKMFVLGVMAIFKLPLAELPQSLQPHVQGLIVGAVQQLQEIQKEPQDDGSDDEDSVEGEGFDELIEQGGYASDEDAEDLQDEEMAAWMRELQRGGEDGSYFMNGMGEDDDYGTSELDNIDEFAVFLETVQTLHNTNPQAFKALHLDTEEFKVTCDAFATEVHRRQQEAVEETHAQKKFQKFTTRITQIPLPDIIVVYPDMNDYLLSGTISSYYCRRLRGKMDAIGAVRGYVEKILLDPQLEGMKALVLDAETTKAISMVISQSQILEKQVFLVEQLGAKSHERMQHLKAAVLLRPTLRNLELLKEELIAPKYGEYHVFFTNITSNDILERLAEADEHEVVQQVHEYYADYLAINDHLFHFNLSGTVALSSKTTNLHNMTPKTAAVYQRTVDGLLATLLSLKKKPIIRFAKKSEISEKLARDVAMRMQHEDGLFDFRQPSVAPVLLILDRKDDPITPLLSQWAYQAMVHELLGLFENRVDLERVPGVRDDMKQVVLSVTSDPFFAQHMHDNFGEICLAVKELVDQYKKSSKQNENIESIEDMQRFVDKYAEFRAQSVTVSKHVTLMGELNRLIEVQGLMDVSTLEQDIACNDDASGHLRELTLRLRKAAIAPNNKLRLALLYALRYENPSAIKSVKDLLLEANVPSAEQVNTMLAYGGANARSGDLFGDKGLKKFIKAMTQVTQGLQGVQCVLTQHVPFLMKTLDNLLKGQLPDTEFGSVTPSTPLPKKLKDVIVYINGGVTFEESLKVAELNAKLASQGQRILLGGPMIHNSESFLKELVEMTDGESVQAKASWKYEGKHL
ncbi:hypothetical protein THRCLA_06328, partial [Thraustotheca clavata]